MPAGSKKKKAAKNAFSFYLDVAMLDLRRDGFDIKSKQEAVPYVNEKWKKMTAAEKAPYEEKARKWKMTKNDAPRPGRLDCTGNAIDDRIDMDKKLMDERNDQRKYLLNRWAQMTKEQVMDEHFFIISFQSFFEFPNEEGYQPCEVACIDFSLRNGICNEWHNMINPGPLKMGLGAESKIFSDRTHKIPVWGFEAARDDHHVLWRELLDFVNPGIKQKVCPPIYSRVSELNKNKFCMDYLAQLAGVSNRLSKIYQWESMAATLYTQCGIQPPSLNIIEEGANSTMYDYEANTKCDYHDEIECIYCATLTVKKCCFWMSDAFAQIYGYEVTDSHLPARQAPQYTIIYPEDQPIAKPRKKFLGADVVPRFDPNLPASMQRHALGDVYSSGDSSVSSSYASRDIRYRPKYRMFDTRVPLGRGTTIPGNTLMLDDASDCVSVCLSVTDTIDDIGSSILSDSDSDTTCNADDEGSEISYRSKNRMPKTKAKTEMLSLPWLMGTQRQGGSVDGSVDGSVKASFEETSGLESGKSAINGDDDDGWRMPALVCDTGAGLGMQARQSTGVHCQQLNEKNSAPMPSYASSVAPTAASLPPPVALLPPSLASISRPAESMPPLNVDLAGHDVVQGECTDPLRGWKPFGGRGRGLLMSHNNESYY